MDKCNCPGCRMDRIPQNVAEVLILTAETLRSDKEKLITPEMLQDDPMTTEEAHLLCARVALSKRFSEKSKGFQFRAIMENWDAQRIIQEMY